MRIETFYRGKSVGTEDGVHGLTSYLAFMTAHDHPDLVGARDPAAVLRSMMMLYFDDWFESIYDHHEVHIEDISGNRLFDQYLVTEEWSQ